MREQAGWAGTPVSDGTDTGTAATIDRFNEAFNRHDVDAVMDLMTDDCIFENTSPPDGGRFVGQAEVAGAWRELFATSPDAVFEGERVEVLGDWAFVQWVYRWGDGEADHVRGVDLIRVADGKLAEKLSYVKG